MTNVSLETPSAIGARTWTAVVCVLGGFFVFFVARGVGLEPIVFADEWVHSVNARLVKFSDAFSPSYLYYYLYRPTRGCGFAFLECARLFNIGYFLAAGVMFFLYARRFVSPVFAMLLLVVFLGSPGNIYLLLFTPDAPFYSIFVVVFVCLTLLEHPVRAPVTGFLLGLLALMKINAIFLLPGAVLFFILDAWLKPRRFLDLVISIVLLIAFFLIAKMGVGWLIAGPNGFSITGQHYTEAASRGLDLSTIIARLPLIIFAAIGYFATILLLLATPIVALFLTKRRATEPDRMVGYAAVCILLPALLIFAVFAAIVSDAGPYELIRRLSLRYFNFIFPFFYLFGLSILCRLDLADATSARAKALITAGFVATAIMAAVISLLYLPNLNDSPDLIFLTFSRLSLIGGTALLLFPLALLFLRPAAAARGYLASLLMLCLVWNLVSMREIKFLRTPTPFDAAGRYAALFLGNDRASVTVVGPDPSALFRTMFHLNANGPIGIQLTNQTNSELVEQLRGRKWVLLIGPDALKFAPPDTNAPSGFALVPYDIFAQGLSGRR